MNFPRIQDWIFAAVLAFMLSTIALDSHSADIPSTGPVYTVTVYSGSCGGTILRGFDTSTLYAREVSEGLIARLNLLVPSLAPHSSAGISGSVIPTDGTCLTFTVADKNATSTVYYFGVTSVLRSRYALSVEGAAQIAMAAFLLWGIAFGIRSLARVGTTHHD